MIGIRRAWRWLHQRKCRHQNTQTTMTGGTLVAMKASGTIVTGAVIHVYRVRCRACRMVLRAIPVTYWTYDERARAHEEEQRWHKNG
jgi:hypothetical protein